MTACKSLPNQGEGQVGVSMDWSRDGRYVLFRAATPKTGWDIWVISLQGGPAQRALAQSPFDERTAQFAPDTRWVAYESNESGSYEIYVQPFPGPGEKTRVSSAGGSQPRWRSDGRELFYIAPDGRLMAIPIPGRSLSQTLEPGSPVALFKTKVDSAVHGGVLHDYAVSADGQRFLMNTFTEQIGAPITLILDRR